MSVLTAPAHKATRVSIIVPVYNNTRDLPECVSALIAASTPETEVIVVDDGSTDETPVVAARMGVRVLRLTTNSGPAAARNYGARHAMGEILFFVDADVVVGPKAVDRIMQVFQDHPELDALFGSYDTRPRASGLVSQYRNLLHHYVHQSGNQDAATFWAGCGAIRRSVFDTVGGFEEARFPESAIEDIALGYRLRQGGYKIFLDKALQCTHLKRWTLWLLLRTDILKRAIPWSRLILESRVAPKDLNLAWGQRLSGVLVLLACAVLPVGVFRNDAMALSAIAVLGVLFLNRKLYVFFFRQRGLVFAVACIPLHLLYFVYSSLSYLAVWLQYSLTHKAIIPTGSV